MNKIKPSTKKSAPAEKNDLCSAAPRLEAVFLGCIATMSFLLFFFSETFSVTLFILLLCIFSFLFVVSKSTLKPTMELLSPLWLGALCTATISYLRTQNLLVATLDYSVLVLSMLLCFFPARHLKSYKLCFRIMLFFAIYHAIGVLIQSLFPSLYLKVVSLYPKPMADAILGEANRISARANGFASNCGFAAHFICAGLLVILASVGRLHPIKKASFSPANTLLFIFLFVALLFTGKRGNFLFLCTTLPICFAISLKPKDNIKFFAGALVICAVALVVVFLAKDTLSGIPIFNRIIATIEGIISGKDMSSSRFSLYKWAWRLFLENPVLGIGLDNYRTTTIGNATVVTELDVHNVYLQLLCENGFLGFITFMVPFAVFWVASKNAYIRSLKAEDPSHAAWICPLLFSVSYQTFFLLMALTENVLYDVHPLILYMISCAITIAFLCEEKDIPSDRHPNMLIEAGGLVSHWLHGAKKAFEKKDITGI